MKSTKKMVLTVLTAIVISAVFVPFCQAADGDRLLWASVLDSGLHAYDWEGHLRYVVQVFRDDATDTEFDLTNIWVTSILSAIVIFRHRANIKRLLAGTEGEGHTIVARKIEESDDDGAEAAK